MAEIKAIETVYNGYKFRSRLEARWAVFFDALGIRYEYEKEGYQLPDGTKYLPDFWLPEFSLWVEVKPSQEHKSFEWMQADNKAKQLRTVTGNPVLIVRGDPAETGWQKFHGYAFIDGGFGECSSEAVFAKGEGNPFLLVFNFQGNWGEYEGAITLTNNNADTIDRIQDLLTCLEEFKHKIYRFVLDETAYVFDRKERGSEVDLAAIKARQARFEHGEKG